MNRMEWINKKSNDLFLTFTGRENELKQAQHNLQKALNNAYTYVNDFVISRGDFDVENYDHWLKHLKDCTGPPNDDQLNTDRESYVRNSILSGSRITVRLGLLYDKIFQYTGHKNPHTDPILNCKDNTSTDDSYAHIIYLAYLVYKYPNEDICGDAYLLRPETLTRDIVEDEIDKPSSCGTQPYDGRPTHPISEGTTPITPQQIADKRRRDRDIFEKGNNPYSPGPPEFAPEPSKKSKATKRGGKKRSKKSKITKGKCKYTYKCKPHKKKQLCTYTYKCPSKKSKGSKRGKCKYTYKCKLHKKKQLCKYTYKCSKKSV